MTTPSRVTLRLSEFLREENFTVISQATGIPEATIRQYTTSNLVELTEETSEHLKNIADVLNVSVVELIGPPIRRQAFKLNILGLAQQKGLSPKELTEQLEQRGLKPAILAFYSTQPICKQKFAELRFDHNLRKICDFLNCSIEDLQVEAELPVTKLRIEAFTEDKGLNLKDLSSLTNLPDEIIDLLATQPIDISELANNPIIDTITSKENVRGFICVILGVCIVRQS